MKKVDVVYVVIGVGVPLVVAISLIWGVVASTPKPLEKPVYSFGEYSRSAVVTKVYETKVTVEFDNGRKVSVVTDGEKFAVGDKVVAHVVIEYVRYWPDTPAAVQSFWWSINHEGR